MRTSLALVLLATLGVACGGDSSAADSDDSPRVDPFERGGVHDLSACAAAPEPAISAACAAEPTAVPYALAVCGALRGDNTLTVERTSASEYDAVLAVDGTSTTSAPLVVRGSFTSFGAIDARNTLTIDGSLSTAGSLTTSAPVQVAGDVSVASSIDLRNSLSVGGTLRAPEGSDVSNVAGETALGPVVVDRALACESAANVAALVAAQGREPLDEDHDRRAVRISQPTDLTLGCGRYRFDSLEVDNTLRLRVTGPTMIVVAGNVRIASPMVVTLEPGGSLEWLVGGRLDLDNTLELGSPGREQATWLAVAGDVRIASPFRLWGRLFAPRSSISGDNTFDLHGGAYVGALRVAAPMQVEPSAPVDLRGCSFVASP